MTNVKLINLGTCITLEKSPIKCWVSQLKFSLFYCIPKRKAVSFQYYYITSTIRSQNKCKETLIKKSNQMQLFRLFVKLM